ELFDLVDKPNKIYRKKNVPSPHFSLATYQGIGAGRKNAELTASDGASSGQILQTADRIMLSAYAPAAVVIDRNMQVQQFRGEAHHYLQHAPGPATLNLLQLVHPSLVVDLRNTIHRALKTEKPARRERAMVKLDGKAREVNLQVVPFKVNAEE